jgi:hypothetical protein
VTGVVWQLGQYSIWRGVLVGALIPLEATLTFAAMLQPKNSEGALWQHRDLDALRHQLRVRSDVRTAVRATGVGGRCQQRWGRDVVVIDAGVFTHHEQLAVIAHEFGHTKQSPLTRPAVKAAETVLLTALWVGLLPSSLLTVTLGLLIGATLWVGLLYARRRVTRQIAIAAAWIWWLWQAREQVAVLAVAGGLWLAWKVAVAWSQRVAEHLADEAAIAVQAGPVALSSALTKLSGGPAPRWKTAFASHPPHHRRGANRER